MRLWSLHPKYLDKSGLGSCWREGLLALSVLKRLRAGEKKVGNRNHSQLVRFKEQDDPIHYVSEYLHYIVDEASNRGYNYNRTKLLMRRRNVSMSVTTGQIDVERKHLIRKLQKRSPEFLTKMVDFPDCHPMFYMLIGDVAVWEKEK